MARLAGVAESSLRESLDTGAGKNKAKLAEMLMESGFEGAGILAFAETGIPDEAVAVILEYYAMHAGKRCTQYPVSQCLTAF